MIFRVGKNVKNWKFADKLMPFFDQKIGNVCNFVNVYILFVSTNLLFPKNVVYISMGITYFTYWKTFVVA